MKTNLTMLAFICLFTVSCSKESSIPFGAESPTQGVMNTKSGTLEKKFNVNGQDIVLTIQMIPAVVCYSNLNGQPPKPCDIFIDFTCTLSQPVDGYVTVSVQQKNIIESKDPGPEGSQNETVVVFNIEPNTAKLTYRSSFQNNCNSAVDENRFSITGIGYYRTKD